MNKNSKQYMIMYLSNLINNIKNDDIDCYDICQNIDSVSRNCKNIMYNELRDELL